MFSRKRWNLSFHAIDFTRHSILGDRNKSRMIRRICSIVLTLAFCSTLALAQQSDSSSAEVEKRVDTILHSMTLDEKIAFIGGTENLFVRPVPRLKLRALRMAGAGLGVHDFGLSTAYTAGIALAATWNTDLARRIGENMGKEAQARGVDIILGGGINIYRAPFSGRNFEYLGEDPYLASRIIVPQIEGAQSQNVIATVKHFAANNEEYDRQQISSDVDERTLREIYRPAVEAAVKEAKVGAVMNSYNLINGAYATQNSHLNDGILKKEWGFDGFVMSDWGSTHDGVAAANGGLDLEMPSAAYMTREILLPAIQRGEVSVATIDDKVRRILRKAIQFGFYDGSQQDVSIPLFSQEGRGLALEEAREGMALLKNQGKLLPLDITKIKTIAVLGPNAYPAVTGGGGSSYVAPFNSVSFLEGISNYLGSRVKVLSASDQLSLDEVVRNTVLTVSVNGTAGSLGEYFNNGELKGNPAFTRTDRLIDFGWGESTFGSPVSSDQFSARWTSYFVAPVSSDYGFYVSANDGARLFVDDKLVSDGTGSRTMNLDIYTAPLVAGRPY